MSGGEPGIVADILLRLVGIFYAGAATFTIRAGAMSNFLDRALATISRVDPRVAAAERSRTVCLVVNGVLYGAGGILLAARLDAAAAFFVLAALLYAVYLFVLCPLYFDRLDPPEEPGRSQTRKALWFYLGATAIVLSAWWSGSLRPVFAESPAVIAIVGLLIVGLIAFAFYQFKPWQTMPRLEAAALDDPADGGPPRNIVITPSWDEGGIVDADTGEPVYWLPKKELPPADAEAIQAWLDLFRELADPDDPLRARLKDPASRDKLEAEGRPIYERLVSRLGPERVRFEPDPRPCVPQDGIAAVKVLTDHSGDPLRRIEGDSDEFLSPGRFGVSWSLGEALHDWAYRYHCAFDPDDPDAPPSWSAAEAEAHCGEGRQLAHRLAAELGATGRGDVAVWYQHHGTQPERISGPG